jgi:hypothetical protein
MIPLSFILGAFLCLQSVRLGLKWKMQVENKEIPTIDNPIAEVVKAREESKATKEEIVRQQFTSKQLHEWLNGDGDE